MPVTVKLKGRRGNQMFQIAAMVGYCLDHGLEWIIPPYTENESVWNNEFKHISGTLPDKPIIMLVEKTHAFEPLEFKTEWGNKLIILEGYFQSFKYFDKHREFILNLFGAPPAINIMNDFASIHFRAGDYLLYPTKHPVITKEYIDSAMRSVLFNMPKLNFMVCSDDMKVAEKMVTSLHFYKKVNWYYQHAIYPKDDMNAMAACRYNIIANSTYSWWSGYLNQHIGKVVVAPHEDNWFGPGNSHLSVVDLIPKEWIRIKY